MILASRFRSIRTRCGPCSVCVSVFALSLGSILEQATTDSAVIEKTLDDLVTVLCRVAEENKKKGIEEADTSKLKSAGEIFVHQDRTKQTELVVEMKEKKKKKKTEKKVLTEAEFLSQWEDNDRSVDTIFLPRSRGPLGTPAECEFILGRNRNVDLKRVNIAINGKELLASATLRLHEGRHYGLVGRNGVGKSTLLSRMARSMIDGIGLGDDRVVSRLP